MHITLRQLAVFTEVLKSGSTTQAARSLALSQSAVSASLTDIEGQLGVQLFDRAGKRLMVNEHGRLLYPKALALLDHARAIEQLFKQDHAALRIAASSTIGNYLLPAMMAMYRRNTPESSVELIVGNSLEVIDAVQNFQADIGLIEGPCQQPEILSEPWLEDELVVFAAPTHEICKQPVSLASLAATPWLLREMGSGTRQLVDQLLLAKLPYFSVAMELGNSEAIKHAVRYGMGISCLSRRVIADQLAAGVLQEINLPLPRMTRTLYRIRHQQKLVSRSLQRFLEHCQSFSAIDITTADKAN